MKNSKWFNFFGGYDLVMALILLIGIGGVIWLSAQLDFIFRPLFILLSNILLPIIISFLFYFLINPIVDFVEKRGLKRLWGIVIIYILIVLIVVGAGIYLFPILQDQFTSFFNQIPTLINSLVENIISGLQNYQAVSVLENLYAQLQETVSDFFSNIGSYITTGLNQISSIISSITSVVITIFTVPIILFFLLKDDEKMFFAALKMMPPSWRADFIMLAKQVQNQVGAYIKGQLTIAFANGIMMYIGFKLIGLNYSGVIAIIGGVFSIIPYLGPTLTFIPAALVALMTSFTQFALLVVVWLIVQFIEGNLIEPNVMGHNLSVHPLTIIILLIIMGDLFGIFGLIFGVPIYAIVKVLVTYAFNSYKARYNKYFGHISGEYQIQAKNTQHFSDDYVDQWWEKRQTNKR